MISLEVQPFSVNRILLLMIGLWPYTRSKLVLFQQILLFSILASYVAFQFTIFFTAKGTSDFVTTLISFILIYLTFIIKYHSFWINSQTVKNLVEQLKHVCNELKDENEINVMKRYESNAKRYTTKLILVAIVLLPLSTVITVWPRILDIIKPKNESRADAFWMKIMTQHFIDKKNYYYLFLFHMNASMCIGTIVMVATGTMIIGYFKYVCGMFRIASYRIEQAMTINNLQNKFDNEIVIYKGIIYAVDVHRKAMELGTFFCLIGITVLNLSLNLCRIFQIISVEKDKEQFILHFACAIVTLLYMFIINCIGQEIMDHNNHIFSTVYNVHWYRAPLNIQKLILFLLQMGSKSFNLNVHGLFVASLYCFASLVSASISYFTVIYSIQQ